MKKAAYYGGPIETPMDVLGDMPSARNDALEVDVDRGNPREAPLFPPGFRGVTHVDVPLVLVVTAGKKEEIVPNLPLCSVLPPIPESGIGSEGRDQRERVGCEMTRTVEALHLIGCDARVPVVLRHRLDDTEVDFRGEDDRHGINDLGRDMLVSPDELDGHVWVFSFDIDTADFFDDRYPNSKLLHGFISS